MNRIRKQTGEILINDEWIQYSSDVWELAEFIHDNQIAIKREIWGLPQTATQYPFDKLPYENQRVMLELAWRIIKREHGVE